MARRIGDVDEFDFKAIGENHNQGVSFKALPNRKWKRDLIHFHELRSTVYFCCPSICKLTHHGKLKLPSILIFQPKYQFYFFMMCQFVIRWTAKMDSRSQLHFHTF